MKQFSFLTEVVLNEGTPTIIIRDARGNVVKITTQPEEVATFLKDTISKVENANSSNSFGNEKSSALDSNFKMAWLSDYRCFRRFRRFSAITSPFRKGSRLK